MSLNSLLKEAETKARLRRIPMNFARCEAEYIGKRKWRARAWTVQSEKFPRGHRGHFNVTAVAKSFSRSIAKCSEEIKKKTNFRKES